jgi:hypothetical protein
LLTSWQSKVILNKAIHIDLQHHLQYPPSFGLLNIFSLEDKAAYSTIPDHLVNGNSRLEKHG